MPAGIVPRTVIAAAPATVSLPAASATRSEIAWAPGVSASVSSDSRPLVEGAQGWVLTYDGRLSAAALRSLQAALVSRSDSPATAPSTTSVARLTPLAASAALNVTDCAPVSVPPATSGPPMPETVGGVGSSRIMSADMTLMIAEAFWPVAPHVAPGAPPQFAVQRTAVTPASGPGTATSLPAANGGVKVPRVVQPGWKHWSSTAPV